MADAIDPEARRNPDSAEKPEIEAAKRFRCPECPKMFEKAYALDQHMPTHTGKCRYQCSKCPKKFRRQHDCNRHEKLQHAEKGFMCSGQLEAGGVWGCGAKFRRADALKEHFKSEMGRRCLQAVPVDNARKRRRVSQSMTTSEYQLLSTASSTLNGGDIEQLGADSPTQANTGTSESGRSESDVHQRDARQIAEVALPTSYNANHETTATRHKTPAIAPGATESQPIPSHLVNIAKSLNDPSTSSRPALCLACFQCFSNISALQEHMKSHAVECKESQYTCWDCGVDFHCPITFTAHWGSNQCGGDLEFIDYLAAGPHYRASRLHWGCGARFEDHSSLKAHLDSSTDCAGLRIAADQTIEMTARIYIRSLEISQEKRDALSSEQDAPGSPFSVESDDDEICLDEPLFPAPKESEVFSPPPITVHLAPPSMQTSSGRLENESDYEALSPPDGCKLQLTYFLTKTEETKGRTRNHQRPKAGSTLVARNVTTPDSNSEMVSPIAVGIGAPSIPPSRRPSISGIPNRDYILSLADPTRSHEDTSSSSSYLRHLGKHPHTYQCSLCPKRFTRAYNLRSHLRTHTDERPFVCTVCGKAYARKHARRHHESLHSGEKKFICRGLLKSGGHWGCGRRYSRADALDRHFRCEAGRVCIRPLLEEEAAERQRWVGATEAASASSVTSEVNQL